MNKTIKKLSVLLVSVCMLTTGCSQQKTKALNILSAISTARELTTLKYDYVKLDTYEIDTNSVLSSVPIIGDLQKTQVLYTCAGTICVGFQLEDIVPVVDETAKTITVKVPEPVILSDTTSSDKEKIYFVKDSKFTSTQEKIEGLEDRRAELRSQVEKDLMQDKSIKEKAIEEYKDMCQSWLLKADSAASEYTILFE